jgi:ectoine hydroxylase-related dioxygenase (phytanoyl-CoA dioxygenase family)
MHPSALRLDTHGAEHYPGALPIAEISALRSLADCALAGRSGVRVFGDDTLSQILAAHGILGRIAAAMLGQRARPVRAIVFDKSPRNNWSVAQHQDRTIAVREPREVPGFGPWSTKAGVVHVEPPFDIIEHMITLRAHLDDCDEDNAPLLVAPGSHRLGRVRTTEAADVPTRHGRASCVASAGDVWLYATAIVHASDRARNPRRRRVLHVDYSNAHLPGGLDWLGIGKSEA